jgi:hypothetical protein
MARCGGAPVGALVGNNRRRNDLSSFFPADNEQLRQMATNEGLALVWSTMATSYNDAHRALHVYMGWEPYKPMLRLDGTPYPEDEDDDSEGE